MYGFIKMNVIFFSFSSLVLNDFLLVSGLLLFYLLVSLFFIVIAYCVDFMHSSSHTQTQSLHFISIITNFTIKMAFVANVKSAKYEKYYGCDFKMLKSNEDYLFGVCFFICCNDASCVLIIVYVFLMT